jgi:hypothetical protein
MTRGFEPMADKGRTARGVAAPADGRTGVIAGGTGTGEKTGSYPSHDCRARRGGIFIGSGSVNLKSALGALWAQCSVSRIGTAILPGASHTA